MNRIRNRRNDLLSLFPVREGALSIIRLQKRFNPFVQIDHRPLNDERLSWKAKGLLAYLLSKPADWQIMMEDLINRSTDGRDSVQAAMRELRDAGYAKLDTIQENGVIGGKQWTITELPSHLFTEERREPAFPAVGDELPINGFSHCRENPQSAFPTVGKSTTTNKEGDTNKEKTNTDEVVEEIYQAYPRKVAKPDALKAISRALKRGIKAPDLLAKTQAYAGTVANWPEADKTFIPHPASWFNRERYNDDPATWGRGTFKSPANGPQRLNTPVNQTPVTKENFFALKGKN